MSIKHYHGIRFVVAFSKAALVVANGRGTRAEDRRRFGVAILRPAHDILRHTFGTEFLNVSKELFDCAWRNA
jgi:hypothetical protein